MFGWLKKKNAPERLRDDAPTVREQPQAPVRQVAQDAPTVQVFSSGQETRRAQSAYRVRTAMATHIGTREYQQDAAFASASLPIEEDGLCFGVLCDGMGGLSDGEKAAGETLSHMVNALSQWGPDADIPALFIKEAKAANERVLSLFGKDGASGAGTTLVSAAIEQDKLYWASVGDSRIYILRDDEIVQVTRDHNYALQLADMVKSGEIAAEEAENDPRRDALISFIGIPFLEIWDVNSTPFALRPGDIVLLCSDGLTKSLDDDHILSLVKRHAGNLDEAARVLPLAAFDASPGGQDNTSVVLLQYFGIEE